MSWKRKVVGRILARLAGFASFEDFALFCLAVDHCGRLKCQEARMQAYRGSDRFRRWSQWILIREYLPESSVLYAERKFEERCEE